MNESGRPGLLRDRLINGATGSAQSVLQKRRLTLEAESKRPEITDSRRIDVQSELAGTLLGLGDMAGAFEQAREVLDGCVAAARHEDAARACEIMYLSEQGDAMQALGHGLWLALAFPVDPYLTWEMLCHLVEETPPDSDGAAVAAMLACFVMEKRAADADRDRLVFLARQQVGEVAKRHRGIVDDEATEIWVQMYDLDDVDLLLERMASILEAITPVWWFDRDELRARFPSD